MGNAIDTSELKAITRLILIYLGASCGGIIAMLVLNHVLFRPTGDEVSSTGIFSLPLMIAAMILIRIAYLRGVRDGREH